MLNFWPSVPWLQLRPEQLSSGPDIFGLAVSNDAADKNSNGILGEAIRFGGADSNPLGFSSGASVSVGPFVADRGLLLPPSTPLLFPRTTGAGVFGMNLQRLDRQPPPDALGSSFWADSIGSSPDSFDAEPSFENPSIKVMAPTPIGAAYGQIMSPNAGIGINPSRAHDWFNFSPTPRPTDAAVLEDNFSRTDGAFDPQFIVPVGKPPRPVPIPPGPGEQRSVEPPLVPLDPLNPHLPARPSVVPGEPPLVPRNFPPVFAPPPSRGIGESGGPRPNPVPPSPRPADSAEQHPDESRPVHPLRRMAEALPMITKARDEDAPGGQYEGPDGRDTAVGVRLHPDLPDPAAGLDYTPIQPHLRNGYRGEVELVNRIKRVLPDEIVLHYGMPAGLRGPDALTASPDGDVSIWDSKWRGQTRSIGDSLAGHQGDASLEAALRFARREIEEAVRSGRLQGPTADKALENIRNGNVFINTIGTGSAHGGVVRCVRNGVYVDCWSQ